MKGNPKYLKVRSSGTAGCGCLIERGTVLHIYHHKHRISNIGISILCPNCKNLTTIKRNHLKDKT